MANEDLKFEKISELPLAGPATIGDLVPVVQGGGTKRQTMSALIALVRTALTDPSVASALGAINPINGSSSYVQIVLGALNERITNLAVNASIYPTTSSALLVVPEGGFFNVPSSVAGQRTILYQNVGGSAVEISREPSAQSTFRAAKSFISVSQMNSDLSPGAGTLATVTDDPTNSNNGLYKKIGEPGVGGWALSPNQPLSTVVVENESGLLVAIGDDGGRVVLAFDKEGSAHIGSIAMETRNFDDYFPQIIKPTVDQLGRVVDGYDPVTGKSYCIPIALDPVLSRVSALERAIPDRVIGFYDEAYPSATIVGRVVTIGGELLKEGVSYPLAGEVTVSQTATATVASTEGTLLYNVPMQLIAGMSSDSSTIRTKHALNVVVTRTSDGAVLTKGVDYSISADGNPSSITGILASATSTPVTYTFSYIKERYDVIQLNTETLGLEVVVGQERNLDSHEDFYRAKPTNGRIPLYYVYIYGETATLVDASAWLEGYPGRLYSAGFPAIRQHAQRCLSRVIGKLTRGETIRMAGYGDSITAQGNGTIPALATANGPYRDRTEHYGTLYPYDTRVLAGLFDLGDGMGLRHVKTGSLWTLKSYLESRFGATITYDNWGIGGTTSAATINNGLWPARFTPVLDSKPDLAVLGFGMNELGSSATYANMRSIAEQLIAGGAEIIIVGVPRRNAMSENITGWRYTNRMLRRVALDVGAAYVPYADVTDDPNLGYLGITPKTLCATNMVNHPGYREVELYGRLICALF